jgi:23S rRNA pseudouridine2605 synthase
MMERLQKLIAQAGIASRRHAEELITAGQVTVNGTTVTELGTKADPEKDHIKVRGKLINPLLKQRDKVYVLLNKPKGYLSSVSDPEDRPLVTDLVPSSLGKLHPVGRLDFNTEGLLLLTNDGVFTNFITAARNRVVKVYEVKVKGEPPEYAIKRLREGVVLEDGTRTAAGEIRFVKSTGINAWFEVVLQEGRNQQIRRMFDLIGHSVVKLRRVRIGFLNDQWLRPGEWRLLSADEVNRFMKKERQKPRSKQSRAQPASHGSSRR